MRVTYEEVGAPDALLRGDHPGLYAPEQVNPAFPTDAAHGDPEAAWARAAVKLDQTYATPALHNNAMEPHASVARWDGGTLTVWDSTQGASSVHESLVTAFGLKPDDVHVLSSTWVVASAPRAAPGPTSCLPRWLHVRSDAR